MGDQPERLVALLDDPRRPAAVIANAMDAEPIYARQEGVQRELVALSQLGIEAEELDLRDYFDRPELLSADLLRYGLVWLRGGNVFMLRYSLAASRAGATLTELLEQDALVYGGYSAGPCVLGPTLRGLEIADDPDVVRETYGVPPVWRGLGLLEYAIVPHYESPEHPETELSQAVAERYLVEGVPHRTLRDGQAIVIDRGETTIW